MNSSSSQSSMSSSNSSAPSAVYIAYAILVNLVGGVGIVCNLLLVYATLREKALRGSTNFLLAVHALLEVLHETGYWPLIWWVSRGQNFVPYSQEALLVAHALFGFGSALAAMTSIALDRLLIVTMPLRHNHLERSWLYRAAHALFILLPGTVILGGIVANVVTDSSGNQLVTATMNSVLMGPLLSWFWLFGALNCALDVAIYTLIWWFTKKAIAKALSSSAGGTSTYSGNDKRILKSLIWICSLYVGCQLSGSATVLLSNILLSQNMNSLETGYALGSVLLNIGSASSLPILYITSEEYRKAVRRCLRPLKQRLFPGGSWHNGNTAPKNNTTVIGLGSRAMGGTSKTTPQQGTAAVVVTAGGVSTQPTVQNLGNQTHSQMRKNTMNTMIAIG